VSPTGHSADAPRGLGRPAALTRGDVLTVAEVAALLGCSRRHVYHLVDREELPGARRLGHRVLIVRPVLEAWLLAGLPPGERW